LWDRRGFAAYIGMRACLQSVVVLAGLASWAGSVWAGPGVIVENSVEAFVAPSTEASVAAQLGRGAPVCVLDASNHPGALLRRTGWLAIRLPSGVGYVPVDAVDLAAAAPEVRDCGEPASGPAETTQALSPPQELGTAPRPSAARMVALSSRSPAGASEPVAVGPPALIAGRFVAPLPTRLVMGMGTGRAQLNEQAAAARRIGSSGATFNGTLGLLISDVFSISTAFSVAFPTDNASFNQEVVPELGGGDPHTAESSLSVVSYSIAAGLRTPFLALGEANGGWVATALFAEYGTAGVSGTRTISNCVDCREDDLDMSGGGFWRTGVDLLVPSRKPTFSWGLTVSYQRYAADAGFGNEIRVALTGWLHSDDRRAGRL
jgi:hypothetical protein